MFGYEDRRTAEERHRDAAAADKNRADGLLALGFLKNNVRPLLKNAGAEVGLAGAPAGLWKAAELLVEVNGVTYKVSVVVDHDK